MFKVEEASSKQLLSVGAIYVISQLCCYKKRNALIVAISSGLALQRTTQNYQKWISTTRLVEADAAQ